MVDLERKNPEISTFDAPEPECHSSDRKLGPRGLRAAYWFHDLKIRTGAETISALQRSIEAVAPARQKDVQRRWGYYKVGAHSPSARVVSLAERAVPDSSRVFYSDLWTCLLPDRSPTALADKLLGQTNQDGDDLLRWMRRPQGPPRDQLRLSIPRYQRVILLGSLEALALLVVCTRLAVMREDRFLVRQHYLRVCDFLIVHFRHLVDRGIAQALAEYIDSIFSPHGEVIPHEICRGRLGYFEAAERLEQRFRKYLAKTEPGSSDLDLARRKLEFFQSSYWY